MYSALEYIYTHTLKDAIIFLPQWHTEMFSSNELKSLNTTKDRRFLFDRYLLEWQT